jgi:hypothetical protein
VVTPGARPLTYYDAPPLPGGTQPLFGVEFLVVVALVLLLLAMGFPQSSPGDVDAEKPTDSNLPSLTDSGNGNGTDDDSPLEIIPSTGLSVLGTAIACALATAAVNMEVSIIGTSLVKIVEDLHGFGRQGWVVTGYLITYTSTLVIWAKLSHITGRKWANITSTLMFTVFSGGCGAAQTMDQL